MSFPSFLNVAVINMNLIVLFYSTISFEYNSEIQY